jgi:Protein kinase domain
MSKQRFESVAVPVARLRVLARGDRDGILQTNAEGTVSGVCKKCVRALEIMRDEGLLWFRCPKCAQQTFCPVANIQRDARFAIEDGRPFVTDFFYLRELPAEVMKQFPSPFKTPTNKLQRLVAETRAPGQWPMEFDGFFEIIGELGHGLSGTVYLAREKSSDRRVVIKVPHFLNEPVESPKYQQFMLECRVLAEMTYHAPDRNIPSMTELAERPKGRCFTVRNLVEGNTLEQKVAWETIDLPAGLAVIAEVARAVQRVHEKGFIHANLRPENVLIARDGSPWLIGFGQVCVPTGSRWLAEGVEGTPPALDVEYLRALVRWLCSSLGAPVPDALKQATDSRIPLTAGAFGDAVASHLG